jgi:hypothetical protein
MSKEEKLIKRFLSRPKDFTYDELRKLLNGLGYIEDQKGKTSGSRVAFINQSSKHLISLHKPHPSNVLKMYQLDLVRTELEEKGLL